MKLNKILYYVSTTIFTIIILFSVKMYVINHDFIKGAFVSLGYPTYIIYPYAAAKFLGLIVIWQPKFKRIKEWAYSGFFFAVTLAFLAHIMTNDGGEAMAIIALLTLVISYIFYRRIHVSTLK